jgi:hypothetical protein
MVKTALRAKLGDVLEIETTKGLAYFQYTHQHPVYGGLIRVLPGLYAERPAHFRHWSQAPSVTSYFFRFAQRLRAIW